MVSNSSETEAPRGSRAHTVVTVLLGLAGIAILCALGTWQIERLSWKNGLIAQIEAREGSEPVPAEALLASGAAGSDIDYRPVRASGTFLHEGERAFLSTHDGQAGWNIHTPLRLADGAIVFVNRGFVPYDRKAPETRSAGQVAGVVEVEGLARPYATEKPASFIPDNDPARNTFFWRNLADLEQGQRFGAEARVLPFVIDAGSGAAPGGYPIGGTTIVDIPNNHLQYAVTWFGLAAVLAAMLVFSLLRRQRPTPDADA